MTPELSRLAGDQRLVAFVARRVSASDEEAEAWAVSGGLALRGPFQHYPRPFDAHLRRILDAYRLGRLFRDDGPGQHHHQIRPLGYDYREDEVCALGMELWRADYRAMEPARQIMAATAIWLYRGGKDSRWLRRVPCVWSASEALRELERAGSLEDWLKLVVLYPGW